VKLVVLGRYGGICDARCTTSLLRAGSIKLCGLNSDNNSISDQNSDSYGMR